MMISKTLLIFVSLLLLPEQQFVASAAEVEQVFDFQNYLYLNKKRRDFRSKEEWEALKDRISGIATAEITKEFPGCKVTKRGTHFEGSTASPYSSDYERTWNGGRRVAEEEKDDDDDELPEPLTGQQQQQPRLRSRSNKNQSHSSTTTAPIVNAAQQAEEILSQLQQEQQERPRQNVQRRLATCPKGKCTNTWSYKKCVRLDCISGNRRRRLLISNRVLLRDLSEAPSQLPSQTPSVVAPSEVPSASPTMEPTTEPTEEPTEEPTVQPSKEDESYMVSSGGGTGDDSDGTTNSFGAASAGTTNEEPAEDGGGGAEFEEDELKIVEERIKQDLVPLEEEYGTAMRVVAVPLHYEREEWEEW